MLTQDWWIRSRHLPACRSALQRAFALHCYDVVEFRRNERQMTWERFWDAMCVSRGADYRKKTGARSTTIEECLGFATILRAEPRDFYPNKHRWLTDTTHQLCRSALDPVTRADIVLFVEFCLMKIETAAGETTWVDWRLGEDDLCRLQDRVADFPGSHEASEAIERVSEAVTERLF